ncbi:potassium transporter Kup [Fundidesulfovibrio terrae]|uniref:potassium transporter Kup n=1 Tax=Fundidesulfovibrio terrae TaxID=2922866 RepID=UPI001FAF81A2|nr:KUP/HAK/KT family potassium transporter [Fundidesulfovibrio terrae]
MSTPQEVHPHPEHRAHSTRMLALGALGVVFGDIGTSPLYAMKACFTGLHLVDPTPENVLGICSLILWSLLLMVGLKYAVFMLRVDDQGEGGIFPMLALLHRTPDARPGGRMVLLALFGAALLYGDGAITPVISVLAALEGLEVAAPQSKALVLPLACAVLVGLFAVQSRGSGSIGRLFGPVMLVWFAAIAALGVPPILARPDILAAANPVWGARFFMAHGLHGFLMLGAVVLCVTGAEALHADMGHFGKNPIRLAWFAVALPALVLNYFGQGALLLARPEAAEEPFHNLAPAALTVPLVILATAATIIASQAIISGVYSQTRQAIQLGFMPRLQVVHTSARTQGQIHLPFVTWMMLAACLFLALEFRASENLAEAYGIAVTATLTIAAVLFYRVAVGVWGWPEWRAGLLTTLFLVMDLAFLGSCLTKFLSGGWFPVAVAVAFMGVMITWRDGWRTLARRMLSHRLPIERFVRRVEADNPARVPGTAVFLSTFRKEIPPMLLQHLNTNRMLHEKVVLLSIVTEDVPVVPDSQRLQVSDLGQGIHRVIARTGFMETPDAPALLRLAARQGLPVDVKAAKFYLGRIALVPARHSSMGPLRRALFVFLHRNATNPATYYNIPPEHVLELGVQLRF